MLPLFDCINSKNSKNCCLELRVWCFTVWLCLLSWLGPWAPWLNSPIPFCKPTLKVVRDLACEGVKSSAHSSWSIFYTSVTPPQAGWGADSPGVLCSGCRSLFISKSVPYEKSLLGLDLVSPW